MSLVAFSSAHFSRSGRTLKLSPGGKVVVYFKSIGCRGCAAMDPMFAALAREFGPRGVTFGSYTISTAGGDRVVHASAGTTTPITHTPELLFYEDSIPRTRYAGGASMSDLREFVSQRLGGGARGPAAPPRPGGVRASSRMPDIDRPASIPVIGGGAKGEPTFDEDEDLQLAIPEGVIPKDRPWLCATGI